MMWDLLCSKRTTHTSNFSTFLILIRQVIHTFWPCETIWCQIFWSTLVLVVGCHLFSAKPLPPPMLVSIWQNQLNLIQNVKIFCQENALQMLSANWRHFISRFNEVERAVYRFHLIWLSVALWMEWWPLCVFNWQQYSLNPFHIYTSYQATSECRCSSCSSFSSVYWTSRNDHRSNSSNGARTHWNIYIYMKNTYALLLIN